jgi:hypothetical protein
MFLYSHRLKSFTFILKNYINMKKTIFALIVICICCSIKTNAQFLFGPQFGLNYATLMGTDLSITPKPEWHAGLLFDIGLGKHFSVQPSLLYSKRGYKYDYNTQSTSVMNTDTTVTTYVTASVDAKLGYLDIPVLLNYYCGDRKGLMISAGPQLSILVTDQSVATTTTTTSTNGGTPQAKNPETETKFDFHPTDISLVGQVGYKFPSLLLVYVRAATGFAKVQDEEAIVRTGDEGKNFTIEVGAALTFGSK